MNDCPHCGEEYNERVNKEFCPHCMRYFKFDYESNPFPPMDHSVKRKRSTVNETIMDLFMRKVLESRERLVPDVLLDDDDIMELKKIRDGKKDDKMSIVGEDIKGVELV